MRVRYWGARGSVPVPSRAMAGYGGNTACVEVTLSDGSQLILDAGTGIRDLGAARHHGAEPINLLLTHLHLDHIQGLMFFSPLFDPACDIRVCGPATLDGPLLERLARYISSPLSPVEIRELPARVEFSTSPAQAWNVGPARVEAAFVNHRGATLGYRITDGGVTLAFIPDHEPALGQDLRRSDPEWISGLRLARDADLLIHDSQYSDAEYGDHVGWGHSAIGDAVTFARRSGARRLALFHHDPLHDDPAIDTLTQHARAVAGGAIEQVDAAREGQVIELG